MMFHKKVVNTKITTGLTGHKKMTIKVESESVHFVYLLYKSIDYLIISSNSNHNNYHNNHSTGTEVLVY